MTRDALLMWVERALLMIGIVLAVWCAKVLIVQHYTQSLPIPEQYVHVRSLPGDTGAEGTAGTSGTRGTSGTLGTSAGAPAPRPAPGTVIARLIAPHLGFSTNVLEGSDDGTLARGAGHIEDTALPGESGNVGIAGHRDTIFRPLRRTKVGDELDLKTAGQIYHYRVTRTLIVNPEDVYVLDATSRPTLTLVTCWPFEFIGHAPKRFIVQATLEGS